ncbi:hypothetical protein [Massilia soli]|uniref:DUF4148 domain-containing protein n=1 Tax=Massilia soli TaxID=2792854 RepID=A0ABS7SMG2_9BURK|nr:hypothetical protein [Massilia soli]MBZ2207299.1 hypothetical protein [Massilia soli]
MTQRKSIAIGLMAALPFAALAQSAPAKSDPLDAKAAVTATAYQSAFADYVSAASLDNETSPDKVWRAANDKVAQAEGHSGHHGSHGMPPAEPMKPAPVKQAPVDHSNH